MCRDGFSGYPARFYQLGIAGMLLGADPGLYGGLAIYDWRNASVSAFRIPTVARARAGKAAVDRIDTFALLETTAALAALGCAEAVLEDVHGYGGQDGARSFQFGSAFGELKAALVAAGFKVALVPPSTWKPRLQVPSGKNAARARASELLPAAAGLWPLSGDDGLAEAALLGYYGAHVLGLDGCACCFAAKRERKSITQEALAEIEQQRQSAPGEHYPQKS